MAPTTTVNPLLTEHPPVEKTPQLPCLSRAVHHNVLLSKLVFCFSNEDNYGIIRDYYPHELRYMKIHKLAIMGIIMGLLILLSQLITPVTYLISRP